MSKNSIKGRASETLFLPLTIRREDGLLIFLSYSLTKKFYSLTGEDYERKLLEKFISGKVKSINSSKNWFARKLRT